ncbi:MAG: hypothetical protein AAFX99_01805, partial [Myxococcota bacterium]
LAFGSPTGCRGRTDELFQPCRLFAWRCGERRRVDRPSQLGSTTLIYGLIAGAAMVVVILVILVFVLTPI